MFVSPQVNKEIVSGLKYVQQTYRKGMKSEFIPRMYLTHAFYSSLTHFNYLSKHGPPLH